MNNKYMASIQKGFGKIANFFNNNIYILAIKDGMLAYVPFTIIASVFLIIGSFPVPQVVNWMASLFHISSTEFATRLGFVNDASLAVGGLIVLLAVAKKLAERMELDNTSVVLTALVGYLVLTPTTINKDGIKLVSLNDLGAQGIFLAMLVAIFTCVIYRAITKRGITIKLPASVPPAVSKPFASILPSFTVVTVFWIIRLVLDQFAGQSALALVGVIVGQPLKLLGGSLIGVIFAETFAQFLWFFGIHGSSIVGGVMGPILQVMQDQNKTAYLAGKAIPNIINQSFWDQYGLGFSCYGAVLALTIFAVSSRYKALKKVALVPYIFNIGEPVVFGLPVMLNFTYFIPLILGTIIPSTIAYCAFNWGLVPRIMGTVQVPWTTPTIISGTLITGSWKGGALQLVCLIVSTLIWLPFIKHEDRKILAEEQKQATK